MGTITRDDTPRNRRRRTRWTIATLLGAALLGAAGIAVSQDQNGPPPNGHREGPPPGGGPPKAGGRLPGEDGPPGPREGAPRGQSVDEMIDALRDSGAVTLPIDADDPEAAARWLIQIGDYRERLHHLREQLRRQGGRGAAAAGEPGDGAPPTDDRGAGEGERHRIANEAQRVEREMRMKSLIAAVHAEELRATLTAAGGAAGRTASLPLEQIERALGVLDETVKDPNLQNHLRMTLVRMQFHDREDGPPGPPPGEGRRRGDGPEAGPGGEHRGAPNDGGGRRPGGWREERRGDGGGGFGLRERIELVGELRQRLAATEAEVRALSEEVAALRDEVRALREMPPAAAAKSEPADK